MEQLKYILMLLRQRGGNLPKEEKQVLDTWLGETDNRRVADEVEQLWELSGKYKQTFEPDVQAGLSKFKSRIEAEATDHVVPINRRSVVSRRLWAVAAALLFLLGAAVLFKIFVPDSNTATGPIVWVNDSTAPKSFELPDGTQVSLNSNSSLQFEADWSESITREVVLSGEAFFEVVKDANRPFFIHTQRAKVEVLGTAFNLRAYPDESFTEVTVEEGKVQFVATQLGRSIKELSAGERGLLIHGEQLTRMKMANMNARSWQTGRLQFREAPVWEVIQAVERHYRVKIDRSNASLTGCTLNTNFDNATLEEVFENFRLIFKVDVIKSGDRQYELRGERDCRN